MRRFEGFVGLLALVVACSSSDSSAPPSAKSNPVQINEGASVTLDELTVSFPAGGLGSQQVAVEIVRVNTPEDTTGLVSHVFDVRVPDGISLVKPMSLHFALTPSEATVVATLNDQFVWSPVGGPLDASVTRFGRFALFTNAVACDPTKSQGVLGGGLSDVDSVASFVTGATQRTIDRCRAIAEKLGGSPSDVATATAQARVADQMAAMCKLAVASLTSARVQFSARITVGAPSCLQQNLSAWSECLKSCNCNDPAGFSCAGGQLVIDCGGSCSVSAGKATILCKGACAGTCVGECSTGVACTGAGCQCQGTCTGTCDADCRASSPTDSVECDGACTGSATPKTCTNGVLNTGCAPSSCVQACTAIVAANASCTEPTIDVQVSDPTAGANVKAVLSDNLPALLTDRAQVDALLPNVEGAGVAARQVSACGGRMLAAQPDDVNADAKAIDAAVEAVAAAVQ